MKRFIIIMFLGVSLVSGQGNFSMNDSTNENNIGSSDLSHFYYSGKTLVMAPGNWDGKDWLNLGIATAGTGLLFFADQAVREEVQKNQGSGSAILEIDKYYGSWQMLILSAGLYTYGYGAKNKSVRRLGLKTAEAFIYSGIAANLIKPIIGRRRPFAGDDNMVFQPFTLDNTYHAMPSGHTTTAFAFSTVMADAVDNIFWDLVWYGAAVATGAARIYHDQHWISDVFAGAVLGYAVGRHISTFDEKEGTSDERWSLGLSPGGVTLVIRLDQ